MLFKGLAFGMLLQLAIGPICIFVLNTAVHNGFFPAEMAVLGTVFTDGLEIILAIIGVGLILDKSRIAKRILQIFGTSILLIYGISAILSPFNVSILPEFTIPFVSNNPFLQAVLLALSNPLTVVFWAGIFSAKIIEEKMQGSDLHFFATGCILATFLFLSSVAFIGTHIQDMFSNKIIQYTNVVVGIAMLYFAYKNMRMRLE